MSLKLHNPENQLKERKKECQSWQLDIKVESPPQMFSLLPEKPQDVPLVRIKR